jgi:hypothetical protein
MLGFIDPAGLSICIFKKKGFVIAVDIFRANQIKKIIKLLSLLLPLALTIF